MGRRLSLSERRTPEARRIVELESRRHLTPKGRKIPACPSTFFLFPLPSLRRRIDRKATQPMRDRHSRTGIWLGGSFAKQHPRQLGIQHCLADQVVDLGHPGFAHAAKYIFAEDGSNPREATFAAGRTVTGSSAC